MRAFAAGVGVYATGTAYDADDHARAAAYAASYAAEAAYAADAAAAARAAAGAVAGVVAGAGYAVADISYAARAAADDAGWLEGHNEERFGGAGLIDQPLWLERNRAGLAGFVLTDSERQFAAEHGFSHWIAWYEALFPADPAATPLDTFGEALTLRIATQPDEWWNRPYQEINADISRWLEERDSANENALAIAPAIAALPKRTPAPVNFGWRDDVLEPLSPETAGDLAGLAQGYLDEARDQALHTQARIGGNADPSVVRVVARVVDELPGRVEAVRPACLDARCLALGVFLDRYDRVDQKDRELSEFVLADLEALMLILKRLCSLLPDFARDAVESMAKDLDGKEDTARPALIAIIQVAAAAPISGPSARPLLAALSEELSRPPDEPERRRWLAIAGTTIRDWLLEAGRFARKPVDAVTRELKALATDI